MTSPTPAPGRLGRRFVGHDDHSRNFGIAPYLGTVERRPTFWPFPSRTSAPCDQGQEGECVSHSLAHELGAGPVQVRGKTSYWAHRFFARIQAADRAMGNDFGPDGGATMLAGAKAAKAHGHITGYRWCFGVDQVVDALCSVGPVWLGVPWYESGYDTFADGLVEQTGRIVGGHAITAVGYDEHPRHGPVVVWVNSWGRGYGVADRRLNLRGGVGYIPLATLDMLLRQDGEAVIAADYLR